MASKLASPALFLSLAALLFGASAAWAENEPVATAPVPQAPAATGPMTPVQKEAPAATAPKPSIAMPAETPAAKPPAKAQAPHDTAAPTPAAKGAPEKKDPAPENPATPPAKTAARPKRPIHRHVPEREHAMRSDQPVAPPYYGAPSPHPYERGYDETWREGDGPGYRTPAPYYGPAPYQREEMGAWRAEPGPYGYAPPSYYRDMPPGYAPYPGAPPPPWRW